MEKLTPLKVIKALKETNSRLKKESIISDAWDLGCVNFFKGAQLAYDSLITFGVKQIPKIKNDNKLEEDMFESSFSWDDFNLLSSSLIMRKITGNAAKNALYNAASVADINEWNNWYRPILLKDLRVGVSETTINKVLKKKGSEAKKYLTPKFQCQLAKSVELSKLSTYGERYVDQKLDGVRIITVINVDSKTVTQYTRNGRENHNFPNISNNLKKIIPYLPGSIVLDGEMISQSFQELMTQVNRKKSIDTSSAKLALFDIIPLHDFKQGKSSSTQKERTILLSNMVGLFQKFTNNSVYVIPKLLIDLSTKEGIDKFNVFYKDTISAGYEGVVIKKIDGVYECKRTSSWLKLKPIIEVSLEIKSVEEGTGRNKGTLGALVCEGIDENKHIKVNVGSGYSDEQRSNFWKNKNDIIGQIVEITADAITSNSSNEDIFSLRFPRFLRFRGIEKKEKI